MRIIYPYFLLLIPLTVLVFLGGLWLLSRKMKGLTFFANATILKNTLEKDSAGRKRFISFRALSYIQLSLISLGLVLAAVAASRPQWGSQSVTTSQSGRNLFIALDVSRSMLAQDVRPNRLERAKVDILDLIADLKGDRAGVLAFRGKGIVISPLTTDYAFLRQAIDGISIDSAPRGETDIADAITKCLDAFAETEGDNNAIILISDGEDLAGRAVKLAKKAGEKSIPIFTIGIGDPSGAAVPSEDGKGIMKFGGKEVSSRLTESTLKEIATLSGGVYIPLATSSTAATTLGAIYREHLAKIAAKEYEEMMENRYVERYQLFLIPAIILLVIAGCLSKGRLSGNKPVKNKAPLRTGAVLLAAAFLAEGAFAASREAKLAYNQAVDAYNAGDITNASAILLPFTANKEIPIAAELFAASEFKRAADPQLATNLEERINLLSSSSSAFQKAIENGGDRERLERNLYRAASTIPALREEKRLKAIEEKYAQVQPGQLFSQMLQGHRANTEKAAAAFTNQNAKARIGSLEAIAAGEKELADIWVAARPILTDPNTVTNENMRAVFYETITTGEEAMKDFIAALEDAGDSEAAKEVSAKAENAVFGFWGLSADPPSLIAEGIYNETNVVISPLTPRNPLRDDSLTSFQMTRLFAERFPEWAKNYIAQEAQKQQQSGSTNPPSFTEENVAKINELIEPLMWIQGDNAKLTNKLERVTGAKESLNYLRQIQELLPKNGGGSSGQPQAQQQPENQEQQEQNQDQNEDQNQQEQQEQQQEAQPKEEENREPPKDVEEALRKALQREREHEAEKERQRRAFPLPPNARDW